MTSIVHSSKKALKVVKRFSHGRIKCISRKAEKGKTKYYLYLKLIVRNVKANWKSST
jgi:hypothetical protein